MATSVLIRHRNSGLTRQGYVGFSWTYLFFGWLVPLFRMLTGGWALATAGSGTPLRQRNGA